MKRTLLGIAIVLCAGLGIVGLLPEGTIAQSVSCVGSSPRECFPLPGSPSDWGWTSYLKGACLNSDCSSIASKDHMALDIGAGEGTTIFAPWDGVVEIAESPPGTTTCGGKVQILHAGVNKRSYMCHFQRTNVTAGQRVSAGDIIGYVDSSGKSFGNHLHIQILDVLSGAPLREQQVSSLPAFRGINAGGIAGGVGGAPLFLTASGGTLPQTSDIKLNLELTWPRLPGTDKSLNELVEGKATIYLQNIIVFIFIFVLWLSVILAFVAIVYAGFTYLISGANPGERSKSIQGIKNVVIGIGILLSSVVLLNFINPSLTNLSFTLKLPPKATQLLAPTAPTASGGMRQNTTDHQYAPIPYTDRTGTEDVYAGILVQSEAVRNCIEKEGTAATKCKDLYELEITSKFKAAGAVIVEDDDATQVSCAAVCMKLSGDPLNCRQFGSGGTDEDKLDGGAKSIWNKLQQEPWELKKNGYYGEHGSPSNNWLIDNPDIPGDEDLASRQCLASYVTEAINAPGDYRWDACMCATNPAPTP